MLHEALKILVSKAFISKAAARNTYIHFPHKRSLRNVCIIVQLTTVTYQLHSYNKGKMETGVTVTHNSKSRASTVFPYSWIGGLIIKGACP